MHTKHSKKRAQQRCIPHIVQEWLEKYGDIEYGSPESYGYGVLIRFFSQRSRKKMERYYGKQFINKNQELLKYYRIEDSRTGAIITTGILKKRVLRK